MPTWTVTVDYDGHLPASEQDALDQAIDRLADAAGEVMDSGSGAGFGRRHLDYSFGREDEADRLVISVGSSCEGRIELDLLVQTVEVGREREEV